LEALDVIWHDSPLFYLGAGLLMIGSAFFGYVFCLLVISGYELRRGGHSFLDHERIKRLANLQAAKGGIALAAIIVLLYFIFT